MLGEPGYERTLPQLKTKASLEALLSYASPRPGAINSERAASVRRLAQRLQLATDHFTELGTRIRELATANSFRSRTSAASVCLPPARWLVSSGLADASPAMRNSPLTPERRPWRHHPLAKSGIG
ncbi:MAG: hypothetical protein AB7N24_14485 [Dehalococcoidia bacterium]